MLQYSAFISLQKAEKKTVLIEILQQIADDSKNNEISDMLFMLQASDAYKDETLNQIYQHITEALHAQKAHSQQNVELQVHIAHELLELEAKQEGKEADDLINSI